MPDLKRESPPASGRHRTRLVWMESISYRELEQARRRRPLKALRRVAVLLLQVVPFILVAGILALYLSKP